MSTVIDYKVYNVTKRRGKDDYWNPVGGAFVFQAKDGRIGISIPNFKLVLMEPKPEERIETDDFDGGEA
ncbi:MAG: hypothetical protein K8F24_11855 [Bacteroidales bacterium]|nr:hypothetical protein [Bacteroidales bacterium]